MPPRARATASPKPSIPREFSDTAKHFLILIACLVTLTAAVAEPPPPVDPGTKTADDPTAPGPGNAAVLLPDGTLESYFRRGVKDGVGFFRSRSTDNGRNWSEPVAIAEQCGPRNNGLRLASGELLVPFQFNAKVAGVLRSEDHGKTWTRSASVTSLAGAAESSVAELSSRRLMMALRTRDGFLWRAFSDDRSKTWTAPEKTALPASASPPNVFRLRDGRLLLTHHDSATPLRTYLTMRVSGDDGAAWGESLTLAQIAPPKPDERDYSRQVTHASVAQVADGTLVVVWVKVILSDDEQYGSVESARVKVE